MEVEEQLNCHNPNKQTEIKTKRKWGLKKVDYKEYIHFYMLY